MSEENLSRGARNYETARRLPSGEYTTNPDEYDAAWGEIAAPLAVFGWSLSSFDPGLVLHDEQGRIVALTVHQAGRIALVLREERARADLSAEIAAKWQAMYRERQFAYDRVNAVLDVIEANGCDCECEHVAEDHDEDCDRCLACRIEQAAKQ